jgi:serine/threonine protein phosphatase PrpC
MTAVLTVTALCHKGLVRAGNQDALLVGPWVTCRSSEAISRIEIPLDEPILVAVADGMGGHARGDVASELVLRTLADLHPLPMEPEALSAATFAAHLALFDEMAARPETSGMGSTLVAALLDSAGLLLWCNVGDSRAYREEQPYLVQLSEDDAAATGHLTQTLGGTAQVTALAPHLGSIDGFTGRLLLCSDGLSGVVEIADMERAMAQADDDEALERLWELVVRAGAPDNVTMAMLRVEDDGG